MKRGEYCCHNRDRQWSNERDEFEHAGDEAHNQPAWQTEEGKSERANHTDKHACGQLRANVSSEGAVDVLKKLVTAPAPAATWQHQQSRPAEALRVFQQEESKNRDQDEPRKINDVVD